MKRKHFIVALMAMLSCFAFTAKAQTSVSSLDELKAALASTTNILVDGEIVVDEAIAVPAGTTVGGDGTLLVRTMVYVVSTENPYPGVSYNKTATKNGSISGTVGCNVAYEISLDGGETWFDDTTNGKAQAVTVKEDGTKSVSASFQSAFTSARSGEIVHMLKDAHVQSTNSKKNNGPLRSYYGLILEGNGHTIYTDLESSGASNEYATIKFTSYLDGTGADVRPVLKNVTINSQNNSKADLDLVSGDVTFTVSLYNVNLLGKCQYASFSWTTPSAIINKSNVKLYDCTIPSWDAGSAKLIEFYSGDYSLSFNAKCKVYGGTFSKNPSSYLADCAQVKQENGKYVVSYKAAEVKVEVTPSEEFTSNATEEEKAVANELAANTAVSNETLTLPVGVSNFTVQLTDIEATAEATTKVTFNVEPKNASGAKVSNPSAAITFRLPVPAAWSGKANVYHEGTLLGAYDIKEDSGAKYVEVSSSSFSEFSVEAIVPTEVEVATLAELQAALADNSNELPIIITETIVIPEGETVVLDLNGKTVTVPETTGKHIYALNNKGSLTLKDTKGNGSITARGIYNGYNGTSTDETVAGAKMTIESGKYIGMDTDGGAAIFNCAELVVNGGDFTGGVAAINNRKMGVATITAGNYHGGNSYVIQNNGGQLTIDDATVDSGFGAVGNYSGTTVINDGTYLPTGRANATCHVVYVAGAANVTINGGTFKMNYPEGSTPDSGSAVASYFNGTVVINGGSFTSHFDNVSPVELSNGATIKGGTYLTHSGNASNHTYIKNYLAENFELGADGTVAAKPVAEVNGVKYASFAEAAAAAQAGNEIKLLANIEGDITVPANVTLNGNGFAISAGILAEGDITFAGVTTAADFDAKVVNTAVNIPAGASLQLTGSARLVIGHGATFNITGTIEDAKTADKATLVPSLKIAAGASITGNGVTFNVNNAYIVANANTTSKNSNANGTLDFNINNSIWEQTGVLAFYVPTSGKDPVVNFELKNSVLTTTSHLVFSVTKGEIVIDNSLVNQGTSRQIENRSTMTIKNGSVVNGAVATSSNAKNPGTVIVENATYAVTGEFSGSDLGTGTLIIKKGATVSAGSITKADITVDAEGMTAADKINLTANLSKLAGELSVINNDKLEAKIVDGKVVLAAKPVAKIGETPYTTIEAAFAAATEGQTITMLDDATPALTSQRAITKAAVIDLGAKTMTLTEDDLYFGTTTFKNGTIVVDPSVKPSTAVFWMFANQTLTFDNVKIVATGVTGTYLIGLDGNNSDLNLLNGSEILVENTTALDLDIICVNASTGNDIKVENSKVNVTNLDGRVFFRGNYTVKDSEVNLAGITKAGFRIESGQTLSIEGTSKVNIEGEPRDGGIHLVDLTSTYTKAETATVNATLNRPAVAKIGETPYYSFAEAAAAANAGDEIVMLADATVEGTLALPAGIKLTSNGHTINGSIRMLGDLTLNGPLTITGGLWVGKSGETLTATLSGDKLTAGYFMFQRGTYTINADIDAVYGYLSYEATFEVNSTIHTTGANGEVLYINGNVTLNDGAVLDSDNSVFVCNDNAVLTLKPGSKVDSNVNITVSGAKLNIDATGMAAGASANITGTVTNSGNGTIAVVGNDNLEAQIVNGKVVLAAKPVAKIGETYYATLQDAVNASSGSGWGAEVTLLKDITLEGGYADADEGLRIEKSVTINGAGHTIDCGQFVKGIRIYQNADKASNVMFKNINIVNNNAKGRCIDTRSGKINLQLNGGVNLTAHGTNSQPLTIGGSEAMTKVAITGGTIDAGTSGYAVICFVPVTNHINVQSNAVIKGLAAFYLKEGVKNTSIKLSQSTSIGTNKYAAASGDFGAIVIEGSNNTVRLEHNDAVVKAVAADGAEMAAQAAFLLRGNNNTVGYYNNANAQVVTEGGQAYWTLSNADVTGTKYERNGVEMLLEAETRGYQFITVEDALRYAKNGDTVKLLANAELDETYVNEKSLTLDLNGKTLSTALAAGSTTNHLYAIQNNAELTITDSSDAKEGKISARGNFNYGTLTLEAGTIEAIDGNGGYAVRNYAGSFTMNGGTIATTLEDGDVPGDGYDASPVRVDEGATFTMNDGVINNVSNYTVAIDNYGTTIINGGKATTIHTTLANSGTMIIEGGEFTCNGLEGITAHALWAADGTTTINGGTFNGKDNYNGFNVDASEGAVVTITGGTFLPVHSGSLYGEGTITVSGGTFFDKIDDARCVVGFQAVANEYGTYTVEYTACRNAMTIDVAEYKDKYENTEEITVGTLTFKRTLNAGAWNAFFVPFEVPLSALMDNYDVAYLNDASFYDRDENGSIEEITVQYVKFTEAQKSMKLHANHPYRIRPKNADAANMKLVLSDVELQTTEKDKRKVLRCGGVYTNIEWHGLYERSYASDFLDGNNVNDMCYAENSKGTFQNIGTYSVAPFRVMMVMTHSDEMPYTFDEEALSNVRTITLGEDEFDATGIINIGSDQDNSDLIFDLQGRRVLKPVKGNLYIINGKKVVY